MSRKHKHAAARELAATKGDRQTVRVVDEFGKRRTLTRCADCDCFEGVHDTGHGPEVYTLPARVVEHWLERRS